MSAADDYTADDEALDALTFGAEASAPWDQADAAASTSDVFLLSTHLRGTAAQPAGSNADLFQSYALHGLGSQQQQRVPASTSAPAAGADSLQSLLSRLDSSRHADLLSSGGSTLADFEDAEFDTRDMLKMVDDFGDAEDEEEVKAAQAAAEAWGAVPKGYAQDAYAQQQQQQQVAQSQIPAPGSGHAPLPAPQSSPAKGMSLADLEAKLRAGAAPSGDAAAQAPGSGLPAALQQLALSGQTGPQQGPPGFAGQQQQQQAPQQQVSPPQPQPGGAPQGYTGPALPHYQHGVPAPHGLSVDDKDRQHFYIPLSRSQGTGFMTKSEIALVFRIQLSQLQSIGDPLSDDFYYQVMQARKGGKVNSSGQAILPVFRSGGQARNADGSPVLPEGTLGRISAFSIHKPKRLMAIDGASSDGAESAAAAADADQPPARTNMFAARTLSYLVEEGFRCLMDLEDVDALLASLAPQRFEDPARAYDRARLSAQRHELCARLVESLDLDELQARQREVASGEHLVFKFYAQPKGRLLLYRALVLLPPPHTYALVDALTHDLQQVCRPAVSAGATDEKLAQLLSDIVYAMPLLPYANEIFSYVLLPQHAAQLVPLVRTHLLCQLLQVLLKKGHEASQLLQQNPHVPAMPGGMPGLRETVQQWRACFDALMGGLRGHIAELFQGLPRDAKPSLPTTQAQAKGRRPAGDKKATGAAAGEKKSDAPKEESKQADASSPAPVVTPEPFALSTRFGMWELMAALFSHANDEQRVWLHPELHAALTAEVASLYGEYESMKAKQREAHAAAVAAQEEKDKAATAEKAKTEPAAEKDAPKDGASATDAKAVEPAPKAEGPRRPLPHSVPPAASLPPPPSPALRFLSSALLGEGSAPLTQLQRTWGELHSDYMYYQMKHQQKVAQEQERLATQQRMRHTRQAQQQQQWQAYQQRGAGGQRGPSGSPQRGVAPQHAHFHVSAPHMRGPLQFTHTPLSQQHEHAPHRQQAQQQGGGAQGGTPQRGQRPPHMRGAQQQHQQGGRQQQQAPVTAAAAALAVPAPTWVKPGTSGVAAVKAPAKAPQQPPQA